MSSLEDPQIIHWCIHLRSSPHQVYQFLETDEGRAQLWAESAVENDGRIHFHFPNCIDLRNHDPRRT